jgi:exodeoxyribonuclease VII large subunit
MNVQDNGKQYLTISSFTRIIKQNLEGTFQQISLQGEISNFKPSTSGHWYLSLKDHGAAIKAIIFRNSQSRILSSIRSTGNNMLKDGMQVLVDGRLSVYERRGEYSIIIENLYPAGQGDLALKFEMLKNKLHAEGLFRSEIKKPLPPFPTHVGIIASPTSAALQDILNVINRRFPAIHLTVFPASVQGDAAKFEIVKALDCATWNYSNNQDKKVDVLILARGGGSLEDLWAFNEEMVAYAISRCPIPIVTGVGHETDVTIADFVSDVRAPTPSAAAELVVKSSEELLNTITSFRMRIEGSCNNYFNRLHDRLTWCSHARLNSLFGRLIESSSNDYSRVTDRMIARFREFFATQRQKFYLSIQKLEDLSPLKTLARGYSVVLDKDGSCIRRASSVKEGDSLDVILERGSLQVSVEKANDKDPRFS